MQISEFRMLVHGPFATNIYVDFAELEALSKLSLNQIEIKILEYVQNKPRTEKSIARLVGYDDMPRLMSELMSDMESKGLLELQNQGSDY